MATRVEKLSLESGGQVLIEVYEVEGEVERVGVGDKAAKTLEAAWDTVVPVIQSLSKKIAACGPTESQIKFGVKVSTDLNAVIASAKGEANFEVTLSWKPSN
jgi:Trypsin-co-occurring domain 1